MAQLGWLIDLDKCTGCDSCTVACKAENNTRPLGSPLPFKNGNGVLPDHVSYRWVVKRETGVYPNPELTFVTSSCNHCEHPACLASCPYDARFIHPDGYADKCTFCTHRVEKGMEPACVAVCPTHCMHFGDLDDPNSEVSRLIRSRKHHLLLPAAGTGPRIYFLV